CFTDELCRGNAEQRASGRVGFGDHTAIVEDQQRVRGTVEHRMEETLAFLKSGLCFHAGSDIQYVAAYLYQVVVAIELTGHARDRVDQGPIPPSQASWIVLQPFSAPELLDKLLPFFRIGEERAHVGADCLFVRREAQHSNECGVTGNERPVGCCDTDA